MGKIEQQPNLFEGLTFSHLVAMPTRMEAKTKDNKKSYLNKGQMVSVYKNTKTGKLSLYVATDGRYCKIDE